jgi:hypothetical protein
MVEELVVWCAHRGARVAEARAYQSEGDLGYGTVISWLRAPDFAEEVRRASASGVKELARLLPELGRPEDTGPGAADEAERRRRLFEAVAGTLRSSDRPLLLVADDAQWADELSIRLIHYLVRTADTSPLLVVATVRHEELDDDHPLSAVVGGLQILDRITQIALGRLSRSETETLARNLTGGGLDTEHVDELFGESEGNPLFVIESIRAGARPGDKTALSPKLQAVISARLRQLSGPARDLLGVAATVGRAFTADLLLRATGLDDVALVRGLDELWRRGVIREHGRDAYDFSHGKICDAAYEGLTPATRGHNHLLIAETLQELHDSDPDAVSGQIAVHYDRAGQVTPAVTWYLRAARQAQRMFAAAEALRLLERAQALVADLDDDGHRRQELAILSALPAALVGVESFASEKFDALQSRALQIATRLGVELEPSVLRSLVMSRLCRDDFDEAQVAAERLRVSAERVGDDGLAAESAYLLGITAFWSGRFTSAREKFEHVVHVFSPAGREAHLLRFGHDPAVVCLSRLANTFWFLGDDDAARRARDRAVEMAVEIGHPLTRDTAYTFAILLSADLDERDRYRSYVADLTAGDDGARLIQVSAIAYAGYAEVLDGHVVDGLAEIRRALVVGGPRNHAPGFRSTLQRLLLSAHAIMGDAEAGLRAVDEVLGSDGSRIWEAEHRRLRAEFLAEAGALPADVEAELTRAAAVARRQGAFGLERRVELSRTRLVG